MRLQIQNNVIVTGNGSKKKCARTIAGGSRASLLQGARKCQPERHYFS
jgi:hypothetical protein